MHDEWIWRNAIIKELRKHFNNKYQYKVIFQNNKACIYLNNDNIVTVIMNEIIKGHKYDFDVDINIENYSDITESMLNELIDIAKTALENS